MTKRARMTTQDLIDAISDDDGDSDVDDPDEPFMDGSDDDFSDLDGEELDDDNMSCTSYSPPVNSPVCATAPPGSLVSSPAAASPTTPSPMCTLPAMWTTSLQLVTINPFQSAVGPTFPVPDLPLGVVFHCPFVANDCEQEQQVNKMDDKHKKYFSCNNIIKFRYAPVADPGGRSTWCKGVPLWAGPTTKKY